MIIVVVLDFWTDFIQLAPRSVLRHYFDVRSRYFFEPIIETLKFFDRRRLIRDQSSGTMRSLCSARSVVSAGSKIGM